jgi:RimK family alpha-L-glutamate ligase
LGFPACIIRSMRLALIAHCETEANLRLVEASPPGVEMSVVRPSRTVGLLGPGDAALVRLDVLQTLDGIEQGNMPALQAMHDKLKTARALAAAGVPHPRTEHLVDADAPLPFEPLLVLKPRFGSWGRDVVLCSDRDEFRAQLEAFSSRPWFRRHGALAQELAPPLGRDLRIVVAGNRVVGAIQRIAAPGEWRTNVALGGGRRPASPPEAAQELALAAAAAPGADLVGVDLLPTPGGGWIVIELNGAVEFNDDYSLGRNVFEAASEALVAASGPVREQLAAPA